MDAAIMEIIAITSAIEKGKYISKCLDLILSQYSSNYR
ncbi:hypothetical protein DYY67_1249 [Candidatus Nitrosotalea sp. TS]|nr:hypothetical protein [Candidatus Nitrosotalea sp. TS]